MASTGHSPPPPRPAPGGRGSGGSGRGLRAPLRDGCRGSIASPCPSARRCIRAALGPPVLSEEHELTEEEFYGRARGLVREAAQALVLLLQEVSHWPPRRLAHLRICGPRAATSVMIAATASRRTPAVPRRQRRGLPSLVGSLQRSEGSGRRTATSSAPTSTRTRSQRWPPPSCGTRRTRGAPCRPSCKLSLPFASSASRPGARL